MLTSPASFKAARHLWGNLQTANGEQGSYSCTWPHTLLAR